jgi:hypothetical protein
MAQQPRDSGPAEMRAIGRSIVSADAQLDDGGDIDGDDAGAGKGPPAVFRRGLPRTHILTASDAGIITLNVRAQRCSPTAAATHSTKVRW